MLFYNHIHYFLFASIYVDEVVETNIDKKDNFICKCIKNNRVFILIKVAIFMFVFRFSIFVCFQVSVILTAYQ